MSCWHQLILMVVKIVLFPGKYQNKKKKTQSHTLALMNVLGSVFFFFFYDHTIVEYGRIWEEGWPDTPTQGVSKHSLTPTLSLWLGSYPAMAVNAPVPCGRGMLFFQNPPVPVKFFGLHQFLQSGQSQGMALSQTDTVGLKMRRKPQPLFIYAKETTGHLGKF